jgi:hypothetical protein
MEPLLGGLAFIGLFAMWVVVPSKLLKKRDETLATI